MFLVRALLSEISYVEFPTKMYSEVSFHKFSKNLRATFKFKAPEG
jgi:hypothetical protein